MQIYAEERNMMQRKRGDRKDGVWIKNIDGLHFIMPHLMPNRCDAEVYIEESLDVTNLVKYLQEKNGPDAPYKTTLFHVMATAIGRTVYERPLLNRFVAGRRIYQRNKVTLAFIVKRQFKDESEESVVITEVDGNTTLEKMSMRILGKAESVRKDDGNGIDDLLNNLSKMPRFLMRFSMCIFRFLDFHGWMPESICSGDSNYATVLISNLGSIKCNAAYHHLNNYGTNSIVITIGKLHKEQIVADDGNVAVRDIISIGATVDERIADGFYFAKSIKLVEEILQNPEILEKPVNPEFERK